MGVNRQAGLTEPAQVSKAGLWVKHDMDGLREDSTGLAICILCK